MTVIKKILKQIFKRKSRHGSSTHPPLEVFVKTTIEIEVEVEVFTLARYVQLIRTKLTDKLITLPWPSVQHLGPVSVPQAPCSLSLYPSTTAPST